MAWHAASTDSRAGPTTSCASPLYNGGPRTVARYRGKRPKRAFQPVVDAFFEKYQAVRAGREIEVAQCWRPAPARATEP